MLPTHLLHLCCLSWHWQHFLVWKWFLTYLVICYYYKQKLGLIEKKCANPSVTSFRATRYVHKLMNASQMVHQGNLVEWSLWELAPIHMTDPLSNLVMIASTTICYTSIFGQTLIQALTTRTIQKANNYYKLIRLWRHVNFSMMKEQVVHLNFTSTFICFSKGYHVITPLKELVRH